MALHLSIGPLKPALGGSWYRDANPVPTSPLADDLATEPSGPISHLLHMLLNKLYYFGISLYLKEHLS